MRRAGLAGRGDRRPIDQPAESRPAPVVVGRIAPADGLAAQLVAGAQAQAMARQTLRGVLRLSPYERRLLLATLHVWFQVQGRTGETARRLHCHRNTVSTRLLRLERLTGWSLADPCGLTELFIAAAPLRHFGDPYLQRTRLRWRSDDPLR